MLIETVVPGFGRPRTNTWAWVGSTISLPASSPRVYDSGADDSAGQEDAEEDEQEDVKEEVCRSRSRSHRSRARRLKFFRNLPSTAPGTPR